MHDLINWLKQGSALRLVLVGGIWAMLLSLLLAWSLLYLLGQPITAHFIGILLATSLAVTTLVLAILLGLLRNYRRRNARITDQNRQLGEALSLSEAILCTTQDGILVVDRDDRPVVFNQRFLDLWRIPRSLATRARTDPAFRAAEFRAAVAHLLEDPDAYLEQVATIYADAEARETDTLFFKDGHRLRRFTAPQRVEGEIVGRIWTFHDITELHREKERLAVFRQLIDGSHDALIIVDPITSEILDCNVRAAELHNYTREELLACRLVDINVGIRDSAAWHRAVAEMERAGALIRVVEHIRSDGRVFPLEVTARLVSAGGKRYVVAIERDISERHAMEVQLAQERDFTRLLFDAQTTLLAVLEGDRITRCNAALADFLGVGSCEDAPGRGLLLERLVEEPGYLDRLGLRAWLLGETESATARQHLLLGAARDGGVHTFLAQRRRLPAPDSRQLLALTDITELEQQRREIEHLAVTDVLTGLLNRARFNEALNQQLYMVRRYGVSFSLAMFDVDRFKAINDTLGHLAGDRVLAQIGQLLRARLRAGDTAARWGGDEFMILMPETDAAGARSVVEAIRDAVLHADFGLGETLHCSFGITAATAEDTTQTLVGRVDEAMYRAKRDRTGERKLVIAEPTPAEPSPTA